MSGRFTIEQAGPGQWVASGELSFEMAAQALRQGDELIRREPAWVIDLARVESGDSAGVALGDGVAVEGQAGGDDDGVELGEVGVEEVGDL